MTRSTSIGDLEPDYDSQAPDVGAPKATITTRAVKFMGPDAPDNPTNEPFSCNITVMPTYAMACAHGDLDITTVGRLTAQLVPLAEAGGEIVVDLSDLNFLGSAGCARWLSLMKLPPPQEDL